MIYIHPTMTCKQVSDLSLEINGTVEPSPEGKGLVINTEHPIGKLTALRAMHKALIKFKRASA